MNPEELLKKGLKIIGLSTTRGQINALMSFLSELKKWNKTFNLTALKTEEEIIIKHFFDSLLYLKVIPGGTFKIADVGSGAGFPGIPIKIIRPGIEVTLIESSRKKATFLRHVVRLLKLKRVRVIEERVEGLGREYEKTYDVVISRATFKIKDILKKASPYVKENGCIVLSKGPRVSKELEELEKTPHARDAVKNIVTLQLPFIGAERNLLILKF